MSEYTLSGFESAFPIEWMREPLPTLMFPTRSDKTGRVKRAPLGLCKIEASLIRAGFKRSEVIIADPRKLDRVIGPDTKAVSITCMDPLGIHFGFGI